jgi:CheY-like chemotaxis protein
MGHRILVVDDNHDSADSLARLLQVMGHETAIAYDGPSAVNAAETFRPHVVLLDIGLPVVDGYEVARRIRGHSWGKEITVIAATGWGGAEDLIHFRKEGFDHHMVKPIDLDELEKLLARRLL